jgi:hypothetical protein
MTISPGLMNIFASGIVGVDNWITIAKIDMIHEKSIAAISGKIVLNAMTYYTFDPLFITYPVPG